MHGTCRQGNSVQCIACERAIAFPTIGVLQTQGVIENWCATRYLNVEVLRIGSCNRSRLLCIRGCLCWRDGRSYSSRLSLMLGGTNGYHVVGEPTSCCHKKQCQDDKQSYHTC